MFCLFLSYYRMYFSCVCAFICVWNEWIMRHNYRMIVFSFGSIS